MALSDITRAVNGVSNVIAVIPQLTNAIKSGGYQPEPAPAQNIFSAIFNGPPALLFHYEGEQTAFLESDITDHPSEDNIAIQDHIGLKPETITTHGFIGELNDVLPPVLEAAKIIANKLTIIPGFPPQFSVSALVAFNQAVQLYRTAQNTVSAVSSSYNALFGNTESTIGSDGIVGGFNPSSISSLGNNFINTSSQTKQQQYFTQFYGYWRSRTLFTIQTPWAFFQHMAIKSLRAIQDAETKVITDFEITFKMIRYASPLTSLSSFSNNRVYNADLASNPVQAGVTNPQSTTQTISSLLGN